MGGKLEKEHPSRIGTLRQFRPSSVFRVVPLHHHASDLSVYLIDGCTHSTLGAKGSRGCKVHRRIATLGGLHGCGARSAGGGRVSLPDPSEPLRFPAPTRCTYCQPRQSRSSMPVPFLLVSFESFGGPVRPLPPALHPLAAAGGSCGEPRTTGSLPARRRRPPPLVRQPVCACCRIQPMLVTGRHLPPCLNVLAGQR